MASCKGVEFVPFAADSMPVPRTATAADGSRVLLLPVPLTFTTSPRPYAWTVGADPPWLWRE